MIQRWTKRRRVRMHAHTFSPASRNKPSAVPVALMRVASCCKNSGAAHKFTALCRDTHTSTTVSRTQLDTAVGAVVSRHGSSRN